MIDADITMGRQQVAHSKYPNDFKAVVRSEPHAYPYQPTRNRVLGSNPAGHLDVYHCQTTRFLGGGPFDVMVHILKGVSAPQMRSKRSNAEIRHKHKMQGCCMKQ